MARLARRNSFAYDLSLIDPRTGEVLATRRTSSDLGVTPEAVTARAGFRNRLTVLSPNLEVASCIRVDDGAVETDQLSSEATFQLHGTPYTLGGVTWVPWGVNSEDDTRTSWQDGGRLVWRQTDLGRDEGEGAAFELTWFPTGSTDGEVLVSGDDACPRRQGVVLCPFVVPAGSLLPSS